MSKTPPAPQLVKPLSALAFMVLTPVLLFCTMSRVHMEQLEVTPAIAYMGALALAFGGMFWWRGLNRSAAVLALAVTYSNAVMIGIPLVSLAGGEAGLVTLFTLIPIHSLVLLTVATMAFESAMAHESTEQSKGAGWRALRVGAQALGRAMLHPVPLPIIAGLLFAQTGWVIPAWLGTPMGWMGKAFGPLALLLVGGALATSLIGAQLRPALALFAIKNLVVPLVAAAFGLLLGMQGLPLFLLVVTAALPIGANAFLFSQRYGVAQDLITASVALSTLLSLVSVSLVIVLLGHY
ncbi:MAG: AEC family transporter [Rhodoferax sp.]|nr:AEC family transporter [Rhodoferax sp.]